MPEQVEEEQDTGPMQGSDNSDLSAFAADPEMVAEFVTESREHLSSVEQRLLLIEKNSSDMESINAVFRAVHTVKGLAGFLELKAIQEIAHEVETLLDHARSRRLTITPPLVDAIFEGVDYLSAEIDRIHRQLTGEGSRPANSNVALISRLQTIGKEPAEVHESKQEQQALSMQQPTATTNLPAAPQATISTALRKGERQSQAAHGDDLTIRIETAKLDRLMDAVGELVIVETLVSHNPHVAAIRDPRLLGDLALLHRITEELQRVTTSIRMVPVGNQFQKTARLIRDLSRQVGKQIALSTSGEETELDKTVAEELAGPLLHMVRNSIDHGIEAPDERLRSGKSSIARICLAAYHQSSQIVIEISDDGRGLNRDKILAKANERGLVRPGAQLSDAETFQLIFEPGFSTAEKLTGISGRGVGMDVVRRHVQRLRGRIEIQSEAGVGTTFFLKLPLTLALIDGLVLMVGDNRYILPLTSVIEIFCASESQLIGGLSNVEKVTLRGSELPVVRLHRRFQLTPRSHTLTEGVLIVTESHGKRFCLFVDELFGKQEIVIKSLGKTFKDSKGLMGCAILSDGRVGLILDVDGIMP